jgi:hypothetical protein
MSRLSRTAARWAVRLVPAGRRDWAEALWAEADQAPAGLARLTWRAGGVLLIAREARLARRAAQALAFAAAAAWIARVAWPGPASNPATAVNRLNVVTLLPVLAGLPLLARWLFGPAAPGRLTRVLRCGVYAAVLVLALAKAAVEPIADNPAATPLLNSDASTPVKDGMIATWLTQSLFLFIVTGYVVAILALTARRPRMSRATLAIGTIAGLVLGAVMYVIAPLGLTKQATDPWLPALAINLLVALAWILLFGGPALAGVAAVRRSRKRDDTEQASNTRVWQAAAAGFLATAVGALTVAVLGTVTVALMPRAGWAMRLLYPGQHLTAAAAYLNELTASVRAGHYDLILGFFPVIGLFMGLCAGTAAEQPGPELGGGPPRPPGYVPTADPPPLDRISAG